MPYLKVTETKQKVLQVSPINFWSTEMSIEQHNKAIIILIPSYWESRETVLETKKQEHGIKIYIYIL